jgi:hypothetical protein
MKLGITLRALSSPLPACGDIFRCDPGEGDSPQVPLVETPPHPNPLSASSCSRDPASGERERISDVVTIEPELIMLGSSLADYRP